MVTALTAAAQREFDAGNFSRASELFLEIWQRDRTAIPALYNGARAAQLAGQLEKADSLYAELQGLPTLPAGLNEKCVTQRAAIRGQLADRRAEAASAAAMAGNFRLAVELYGDALAMRSDRRDWALRRARVLDLGGRRDEAKAAYDAWLAGAGPQDPERASALEWRAALDKVTAPKAEAATAPVQSKIAPSAGEAPGVPETVAAASAPATTTARWPGWTVIGLGVAAIGVGGGLLAVTKGDQDALDKRLSVRGADGRITGISYEESAAEAQRIGTRYSVGWAVAGVGAVAAALGVVLVVRAGKSEVSVAPTVGGAQFAVAF